MKKRGRPMVYNEVEILKEIHRLKALTVNQIAQLYFNGKIENAYKKIKKMEEKHYIDSTIHFVQGRRQNKVLHLTKLGSERLVSEGVKGIRVKTTTELKPDRSLLHYIVSVNDVFVRLMKAGISVIDSREWKARHGMNRTARARGGVKLKNGDEYGWLLHVH
ncbi:replication-relaxation family protein [Domibacillus sp. A3M-37]|uniref:replication-relaxation family protein n=1 Tax=Domibacillus sp. A3M-37 TaxID=2962037 RepID=UPI0020B76F08|nr:replication-relaxation family protein [Domibacillus sp. A3M-37]MCP3764542.1 replication-relaxation family protein [Domibacillus sp. A3M-37]